MKYDLEIIKSLWIEAKDDLESAKDLLKTKRYSKVMYHCEQSMEKLMKIALACEGYEDVKSHEIVGLFGKYVILKAPEEWQEKLKKISRSIREIERQYPKFRYPFRTEERIWISSQETVTPSLHAGVGCAPFSRLPTLKFHEEFEFCQNL